MTYSRLGAGIRGTAIITIVAAAFVIGVADTQAQVDPHGRQPSLYAGSALSTRFDQTNLVLPSLGDRATVTVSVTNMPGRMTSAQLVLVVPPFLRIDAPECGNLLARTENATPYGFASTPGLTEVGCFIYILGVAVPAVASGEVVRFTVTRIGPGTGAISFHIDPEGDDPITSATQYTGEPGGLRYHPGQTNSLFVGTTCLGRGC